MAFSATRSILVFCVLHMIPTYVYGRYEFADHHLQQPLSLSRASKTEISRRYRSNYDHQRRRLDASEINALITSDMKIDHVEVRCQALIKGMLVQDFGYVTLKPGDGNIWSIEQINMSPDRIICIMFWKKLYMINDIYFIDHIDELKSDWDLDEAGLTRWVGAESTLVQTWREQKP